MVILASKEIMAEYYCVLLVVLETLVNVASLQLQGIAAVDSIA